MLHNAYCGLYMYYIYITLPDFVTMKIIFSLYYYIPIFSLWKLPLTNRPTDRPTNQPTLEGAEYMDTL